VEEATFRGTGHLVNEVGEAVGAVRYHLRGIAESQRVLEGHVEPVGDAYLLASLLGEPVTLHLSDGRRWPCYVQSIGGFLVNRGQEGLLPPESEDT
jgi:hypothetical protein